MSPPRIYVSEPDLSGNEQAYVAQAVSSSWISSTGEFVNRFEREFANACEAKHCITTCNGTTALHLAMLALDIRPGDEVIVPAMSFVATANAVRYVGAEPVFVDVDPDTWCLDPGSVEDAITLRTRAVIAVHLYGHPAPMGTLRDLCDQAGLRLVEDAAEAHLAQCDGRTVGALGDLGAFSFYGNKTLTCGEGGALVLNDDRVADTLRLLRGQGMDPQRRYFHEVVGYNYRLTNVACAILCAQLERAQEILQARQRLCDLYRVMLSEAPVQLQATRAGCTPSPWMAAVVFPDEILRRRAEVALADANVETRPFFHPLHRLPPYRQRATQRGSCAPVCDRLATRGLCLPTHTNLRPSDIERICAVVRAA